MRLRLPQREFLDAVSVVAPLAIKTATPMPLLNYVLITAEKGLIRLEATDLESHALVTIPGTIEQEGRITIEADRLAAIVKLFPAGSEVSIETQDGKATIRCESNEYNLLTLPSEDFPNWATENPTVRFRIEQRVLRDIIAAVEYATASGKEGRRVLFGVFTEVGDNTLTMTATDGKKLSRMSQNLSEVEGSGAISMIIPRKPLNELRRMLGDQGPVDVALSQRQIHFTVDNKIYRTQAIDGKYPDCNAVVPKDKDLTMHAVLDRDRFVQAVRRAGVVANDMNRSIRLSLAQDQCEFMSMAYDVGSFSGKMPVKYTAEPIQVAFNYEFLVETVSNFAHSEITMMMKSNNAPVIFRTDKEPNRLSLLMPIKLTSVPTPGQEAMEEE